MIAAAMRQSVQMIDPLSGSEPPPLLLAWLAAHVAGFRGPAALCRIKGGQSNPTFRISAASGSLVLRRRPLGSLLPSAHAVDREFRVLRHLQGSGVPVPAVHALCDDPAVAGATFYVMDYVSGRVFWDPRLPGLTPAERRAIYADLNRTLATIHRLDPVALGLDDFGRKGNYLPRQVSRWTQQYRAAETASIPAMDRLIEWLPAHLPPEGETRLVHGDFRMDNVLIHPTEPRICAVLDWELSTLGDPRADIAYHLLGWHFTPDMFRGMRGTDLDLLGIPNESKYLSDYVAASGIDPRDNWTFFLVLSMFRLAAILQGIARRALDGNAANADAREVGAKAEPIAELAASMIEGFKS